MAFINTLGRVSRHGQWRLRGTLRAMAIDGRLDLGEDGLFGFENVSAAVLLVTPRPPYQGWGGCNEPPVVLSASLADETLTLLSPGFFEALFPSGWSASVPPGDYDVRLFLTIGPETARVYDEPVTLA